VFKWTTCLLCVDQTAAEVTNDVQMKMLLDVRSNQSAARAIHRHEGLLFKVTTRPLPSVSVLPVHFYTASPGPPKDNLWQLGNVEMEFCNRFDARPIAEPTLSRL